MDERLAEIQPILDSSLISLQNIRTKWPALDLPPLESHYTNRGNISSTFEQRFFGELDNYMKFLRTFPSYIRSELEKNTSLTPAQLFLGLRKQIGIKKPFDDKGKYSDYTLDAILNSLILPIFSDFDELINLYLSIHPEEYPPGNREAVLGIQREIGSYLRYLEYAFPKNEPCLDNISSSIYKLLTTSKKSLKNLRVSHVAPKNLSPNEIKIYEELRAAAEQEYPHYKAVNALNVFFNHFCKILLCNKIPSEGSSERYIQAFQRFLERFRFYGNPTLGTTGITSFEDVKTLLLEYEGESSPDFENVLSLEVVRERCCKTGGRRKVKRTRRARKHRKTRKN